MQILSDSYGKTIYNSDRRICKNCDEILDAQNIPNVENSSFDFVYCWRCDFHMRINSVTRSK